MAPKDGERGLGLEGMGLESVFSGFGVHMGNCQNDGPFLGPLN